MSDKIKDLLDESLLDVNFRVKVKSTNVSTLGYNSIKKLLHVEFHNGSVYEYENVPKNLYDEIIKNKESSIFSVGKYFANNIKNKYKFKKLK